MGYSIAFFDVDPEKHLSRIINNTHTIPCYQPDEVNLIELRRNHGFIIYDFPPSLNDGLAKQIATSIDFCIVPVVLSPLSMGTDGEIITRTFNQLYETNPRCKLLTLINNEMDRHHSTPENLRKEFQRTVKNTPKLISFRYL